MLKIKGGQWSLAVATGFVTAKTFCRMVTITANTQMQQQLLTPTVTISVTFLKMIFYVFVTSSLSKPNLWRKRCSGYYGYQGDL